MSLLGRSAFSVTAAAAAGLILSQACKKDDEVEYPPQPPTNYAEDSGAPATPPPVVEAGAADGAAQADAGPTPLDMITQQALEQSIDARAKKEAKWMKAAGDGALFGGVVPEGGQVVKTLMFDPGKCYAIVAEGGTGITELDIQVSAQPGVVPLPGPVIAVDSSTGPQAAVSPCWKNAFPIGFVASVALIAKSGSGPVAGKIYVK